MNAPLPAGHRRILIVDDSRAIHDDFRKILGSKRPSKSLSAQEAELFGIPPSTAETLHTDYELDSAFQGEEALEKVKQAVAAGRPYALAFMDVRMPPGWDGVETTTRIWNVDADIQIVICTAYSDYSWSEMTARLGSSDRLVILKKPFDNIEALQLAAALTEKWRLGHHARRQLADLEQLVEERTRELRATKDAAEVALPAPDRVLIDGRILLTGSRPLATYPWPDKRPPLSAHPTEGSSDARKQETLWEIKEGQLYLLAVSAFRADAAASSQPLGLRDLMPERIQEGGVFADWFTGEFVVIERERVDAASHARIILRRFQIAAGRVLEEKR
ncbi:MAG TPA: response regulator [Opitutus sp.]|nr:response regulator [Opitutus sp.]